MATLEILRVECDALIKKRRKALTLYRLRNAEIKALQKQIRELRGKVRWEDKHAKSVMADGSAV